MSSYGICYQGSKSRIAKEIIEILPKGERLVDLFGGGGAITHCALLSGKWKKVLYNDTNKFIADLFVGGVNGKYLNEERVITREDFKKLKDTDAYVRYVWSFGGDGEAYLRGKDIEKLKLQACRMIVSRTLHKRRVEYKKFIQMLKEIDITNLDARLESLESLERLERLERLQSLQRPGNLEISNIAYNDYKYQKGDVVYCDPPYEGAKCYNNKKFDSVAFYEWIKRQPYQVYFSSYEISDKSFYKRKVKEIRSIFSSSSNSKIVSEYLYSNKEINY